MLLVQGQLDPACSPWACTIQFCPTQNPKAVRLRADPTEQIENRFEAEIKEIIYHGDHTRVRVNLLGNDDFILKVPNASSNSKLNLGDKVNLGWSSQDCRALDY